jgi:uncharacterized protein YodC (DUF2158 family)
MKIKTSFKKGQVVTLSKELESPGQTQVVVRESNQTQEYKLGDSENSTPPMVIEEIVDKGKGVKVKCVYYASLLDKYMDKWFIPDALASTVEIAKHIRFIEGDTVYLRSALASSHEYKVKAKFKLHNGTAQKAYELSKTYGTRYNHPPAMTVVKVKRGNDKVMILCTWLSRQTGRYAEQEFSPHTLVGAEKVKEELKRKGSEVLSF